MIKRLTQTLLMCFLSLAAFAQCEITFEVDMNAYPGGSDPAGGVFVNATFNGFCGECNPMFDDGTNGDSVAGDGIWAVTLNDVDCGPIEFLYLVGGGDQEFFEPDAACTLSFFGGPGSFCDPACTNRAFENTEEPQIYSSVWNTCTLDSGDVTFCVCSPPPGEVRIIGNFNGWFGDDNLLTQQGSSNLWCTTLPFDGQTLLYKFAVNADANQESFGGSSNCTTLNNGNTNRVHTVNGDAILPIYDWNGCETTDEDCLNGLNPLPMELIAFDVKKDANDAQLEWKTVSDDEGSMFVIEYSKDAINFKEIGTVHGTANSGENNYSFKHYLLANGENYYRLKNVDQNNQISFSDLRSLDVATTTKLSINPTATSTEINIQLDEAQIDGTFYIYNILGEKVYESHVTSTNFSVNVSAFTPGQYIGVSQNGNEFVTEKFVKTF